MCWLWLQHCNSLHTSLHLSRSFNMVLSYFNSFSLSVFSLVYILSLFLFSLVHCLSIPLRRFYKTLFKDQDSSRIGFGASTLVRTSFSCFDKQRTAYVRAWGWGYRYQTKPTTLSRLPFSKITTQMHWTSCVWIPRKPCKARIKSCRCT